MPRLGGTVVSDLFMRGQMGVCRDRFAPDRIPIVPSDSDFSTLDSRAAAPYNPLKKKERLRS